MAGDSFVQVAPDSTGKKLRTNLRAPDIHEQYVIVTDPRLVAYRGRANTFRTPGRAASTQNIMSIYNASATRLVDVKRVMFDAYSTGLKGIATHAPIVRVSRFTTAPGTSGTAIAQVSLDTAETSDAGITCRGDASADGTSSGTTFAITIPTGNVLVQELVPRMVNAGGTSTTGAPALGAEIADRMEFFNGSADVTLRQNQGLVVHLVAATNLATSDFFLATIDWEEYTIP